MSTILILIHASHWLAALSLFGVVGYCLRYIQRPSVRAVTAFCFLSGMWAFFSALIYHETQMDQLILLNRLKLISPTLLPLCILSIAFSLQGKRRWHRALFLLFSVVPTISVLLISSSRHNDLLIGSYRFVSLGGRQLLAFSNGPWFQFHIINAQFVALVSVFIIFRSRNDLSLYHQKRIWLVILAIVIPFIGDGIAVHFVEEFRFMQITPSLLLSSAMVLVYALLRKHFIDVIPFSRAYILDSIGDIYLIFDVDTRLVDFNSIAESQLNLKPNDIGKNMAQLFSYHSHLQRLNGLKFGQTQEWLLGEEIYEASKYNLEDTVSGRVGTVVGFKNITFRKKNEIELEKINQIKTKLLAIMGHDFQGNLSASLIVSQSLSRFLEVMSPQDIRTASDSLQSIAAENIALVEEILGFAKNQLNVGFPTHQIDLKEHAFRAKAFLSPFMESKGIRIELNIPCENELFILGDSPSVMTILRNLISNAIKFSSENGRIMVNMSRNESHIDIMVEDFGEGMSEDKLATLFELEKSKSYGLGLFLCRDFILRLGGSIRAESELGVGTRFFVKLPATG